MKYFTKKMWLGLQRDNSSLYWEELWRKNQKLYKAQLARLREKMSTRWFDFFCDYHRHGDHILGINLISHGKIMPACGTNEVSYLYDSSNPLEIHITLLCPQKDVYILEYQCVSRYILDYPTETPLCFEGKQGLGSWGYDELSYIKRGVFRHEIMMHSGAIILIEFKKFNCIKKRVAPAVGTRQIESKR